MLAANAYLTGPALRHCPSRLSHQERRYLTKAAIPRTNKIRMSSQIRPIPHIIPVGMSVICIIPDYLSSNRLDQPDLPACSFDRAGAHQLGECAVISLVSETKVLSDFEQWPIEQDRAVLRCR